MCAIDILTKIIVMQRYVVGEGKGGRGGGEGGGKHRAV